jgi:hypothetical protein
MYSTRLSPPLLSFILANTAVQRNGALNDSILALPSLLPSSKDQYETSARTLTASLM